MGILIPNKMAIQFIVNTSCETMVMLLNAVSVFGFTAQCYISKPNSDGLQ